MIVWKCQIHFCTEIEKYTFIHWMHSVQSKQKVYAICTFDWKCIELGRRLQSYNKQWLKELSCCYRECDSASQNLKITYCLCVLEMSLFVRKSRVFTLFYIFLSLVLYNNKTQTREVINQLGWLSFNCVHCAFFVSYYR